MLLVTGLCCVSLSSQAIAQTSPQPSEPPKPPRSAIQGAACVLGAHQGIRQSDAETVTSLVCSELRQAGIQVQGPLPQPFQASEVYRVELHTLGSITILTLSHESPQDTVRAVRQLELTRIEEARIGVPRIVQALVHNEPIEETRTVENLMRTETAKPQSINSEFFFGLGLGAAVAVGAPGFKEAYGVELILQHQSTHWAIGGTARFLGSGDLVLANFNLGARYFMLDTNISPFIGSSLGLYAMDLDLYEDGSGGLGAQVEVGIEVLRFQNSRLGVALRADLPFFDVNDQYAVPVGLHIYYLF